MSPIGEMRTAVRFPLKLEVELKSGDQQSAAETGDISAGGVLFYVDEELAVGSTLDFTIALPAKVLGTPKDVLVVCQGRVARSFTDDEGRRAIAAVIDEYRFQQ